MAWHSRLWCGWRSADHIVQAEAIIARGRAAVFVCSGAGRADTTWWQFFEMIIAHPSAAMGPRSVSSPRASSKSCCVRRRPHRAMRRAHPHGGSWGLTDGSVFHGPWSSPHAGPRHWRPLPAGVDQAQARSWTPARSLSGGKATIVSNPLVGVAVLSLDTGEYPHARGNWL